MARPPSSGNTAGESAAGLERLLTIAEAATLTGRSDDTIRRRLGDFPRARRDGPHANSPYLIPLGDLIAAGYDPVLAAQRSTGSADEAALERLHRAQLEIVELRSRVAAVQAISDERAEVITVLRQVIERLTERSAG